MEKTYQPKKIEQNAYQKWESMGLFTCDPENFSSPYTIMLPPPNVTGTLHMGHGFQQTIMDVLARYHRMMGHDTLWQPGTDHAGIATQMVVERQLKAEGLSRHDLGRDKFVEKVWAWKESSGGKITEQMRRLGASVDWTRERFTLDEGLSDSVKTAFVRLYEDGLIYRGERLVNWDPQLQTAVSDLEVLSEEESGFLWHLKYPLVEDASTFIHIATTRPETMLGDMAVAVHPEDVRYQHLIGKKVKLPLVGREIPIVADDYVDPEFGSGCVKITPAHDFNDYEIGKRHQLPLLNILTSTACIMALDCIPEELHGLTRFEARDQIIERMKYLELLEKTELHKVKMPRGDRTHAILEPYLTKQWFVKADILAKPAIKAVESGRVRFVPDNWKNTYFAWMRDIQDWCISRQLWWGHRIPAWYDAQGNIYVGHSENEVRIKHQLSDTLVLTQDQDVFDTWFSSALWPFSTLGWPNQTLELKKYYPTNVLVTGFDIIFFWVVRMIMMGLYFNEDQVPFKDVYITGLIKDAHGQKMSKSKGNVLDPVDLIDGITLEALIEKRTYGLMQPQMKNKIKQLTQKEFSQGIDAYGTDALRFTFCALASTSRDICFDISRMEGYRNFCNKLWNAARFVRMQTETYDVSMVDVTELERNFSVIEQWIWSELNECVKKVHAAMEQYRFDIVANVLYEFVWNVYCDWYLEFSKVNLTQAVQYTLINVLKQILVLLHPIIPFITEEIYQRFEEGSIMKASYPLSDMSAKATERKKSLSKVDVLQAMIISIRTMRVEMGLKPAQSISLVIKSERILEDDFKGLQEVIQKMARVDTLSFVNGAHTVSMSASEIIFGFGLSIEVHILLEGLIDIDVEIARLEKNKSQFTQEILRITNKLSNQRFMQNAPKEIVKKEQEKLQDFQFKLDKTLTQLTQMEERGL